MSSTNHRTWQHYHVGHFSVTIELDPLADSRNLEHHKRLAEVARQLVEIVESHRLPATFAVSDPAHSAATSQVLRSSVTHEFAILGDASWLGQTAGRTRFARELSRRVAQARAAGISVQTLVPRVATFDRNIDLVVKQRITAVAGRLPPTSQTGPVYSIPRALHYGVWELPITAKLPARSGWFTRGGLSVWRRIRRAARDAATFHLLIDAPALCEDGRGAQKTVAWLIRRVAAFRDRGLLKVETLRSAAERLADVPAAKPQQSILRRVA
jgi:hypothetical protein